MANWQIESKCVDVSIDSILMSIYMWTANHIFLFNVKHNLFFTLLRETWLLAFSREREDYFQISRDASKGEIFLRDSVIRKGIGDPQ